MAQYSAQQLAQALSAAGCPPAWVPTMVAVAMVESGGQTDNPNPTSGAAGPWQTLMSAQGSAFKAKYGSYNLNDINQAAQVAVAQLAGGAGISNWTADPVGQAAVHNGSKPLSTQQLSGYMSGHGNAPVSAKLDAAVTPASQQQQQQPAAPRSNADLLAGMGAAGNENSTQQTTTDTSGAIIPPTVFAAPEANVNVQHFGATKSNPAGFDLSAIPHNELGNAERAIQQYITNPNLKDTAGLDVTQRIAADLGYEGSWIQKIPQLYGVLIWASLTMDPSDTAGQLQVLGAIRNTQWYQKTDQNQRAWAQVQSQDPAQAAEAVGQAKDHVLATANQLGVKLNANQMNQIAEMYAAQSYTPTGVLGTASGTSQEWLDQAVVDTAMNIKQTGKIAGGPTNYAGGVQDLSTSTNPDQLFGITGQLFNQFQQIAQQYLMYNPKNPGGGLLTQQGIMKYVTDAIQNWTGSNSFGSSNLINGAVQQFTQNMMEQASKAYPSLAQSIQGGITPQTYTQSQSNLITSTLGLPTDSINFTDPTWNWVIATPDAKTGQKTALSNDQILQKITNPSFSFTGTDGNPMTFADTNQAKQLANNFGQQFAAAFGKGA